MHSRQPSLSTIEADENSSNSSFDDLVRSFNHKVAELQQLVSVRLSGARSASWPGSNPFLVKWHRQYVIPFI
jgi:hypothetical protein